MTSGNKQHTIVVAIISVSVVMTHKQTADVTTRTMTLHIETIPSDHSGDEASVHRGTTGHIVLLTQHSEGTVLFKSPADQKEIQSSRDWEFREEECAGKPNRAAFPQPARAQWISGSTTPLLMISNPIPYQSQEQHSPSPWHPSSSCAESRRTTNWRPSRCCWKPPNEEDTSQSDHDRQERYIGTTRKLLRTNLRDTHGVGHIELHDLLTIQISLNTSTKQKGKYFTIMIAQCQSVVNLVINEGLSSQLPVMLVPTLGLVPLIAYRGVEDPEE